MAAMMEPVSGLSAFLSVLAELRLGERAPYPFYCALLYTIAEGLDAELARYVDANWEELDAMTDDRCLVFVVGDVHMEAAAGHKPFSTQEVYRIADHLGVRASALPCAAFFSRPDHSREVLRVRLADYLVPSVGEADGSALTRGFRGMAAAMDRCVNVSDDSRLDCLRAELVREHQRASPAPSRSAGKELASAASTTEGVEKVLVGGATIASTVLRLLGIGL